MIIIGIGHVIAASLQRLAAVTASAGHGYLIMDTAFRKRTCCLNTSHLCIGTLPVAGGKDEWLLSPIQLTDLAVMAFPTHGPGCSTGNYLKQLSLRGMAN